jgi:hypothetical protein
LVVYWHASRRLPRRRNPHRAVSTVVAVPLHVDAVVHLLVVVDARPFMEELEELEAGVPKPPPLPEGLEAGDEEGKAEEELEQDQLEP